jgi:hypothetical protein
MNFSVIRMFCINSLDARLRREIAAIDAYLMCLLIVCLGQVCPMPSVSLGLNSTASPRGGNKSTNHAFSALDLSDTPNRAGTGACTASAGSKRCYPEQGMCTQFHHFITRHYRIILSQYHITARDVSYLCLGDAIGTEIWRLGV